MIDRPDDHPFLVMAKQSRDGDEVNSTGKRRMKVSKEVKTAIDDDFALVHGVIHHVAGDTIYTPLEVHEWLDSLGGDLSTLATEYIVYLKCGLNDTAIEFIAGGSIVLESGDIYCLPSCSFEEAMEDFAAKFQEEMKE